MEFVLAAETRWRQKRGARARKGTSVHCTGFPWEHQAPRAVISVDPGQSLAHNSAVCPPLETTPTSLE
jgi:hypothetical protein